MKWKRIALIILLMLLGLVIDCVLTIYQPFSPPPEPPAPNQTLWIDAWLENPVCQPPCLDNIIPGVTPADEVAEKLSAHPGVLKVERKKKNYYYDVIQWYTPENETGWELGEVTVYTDTEIVTGIDVYVYSHSDVATILLGDFIDAFGEPDYVYPYVYLVGELFVSSECEAELYYIDKGMWVHISNAEKVFEEKIDVTPNAVISMVALLPPPSNIEEAFNSKSWYYYAYGNDINKVVPWDGYGKYFCEP